MYYLSQFCYCCLGKSDHLLSINEFDTDNISFKDKFKFCYLRTDILFDEVPQLICKKCCEDIRFVYNFRKMFLERRQRLRGYIFDLKEVNKGYSNNISRLSIDVLNIDKFLSNNLDETINLKGTQFDDNLDENIVIKCEPDDFIEQNTSENVRTDEDIFDVDVQTVNFTLHNPFTLQKEDEDLDSNNQDRNERSILTEDNYEIVKNGKEQEDKNGDVFKVGNHRIVSQNEENGLKIVIRKSSKEENICNICDKTFKSEKDLKLHLPTHDTKTDLNCIFCDKKCLTLHALQKHERGHPNKPYNCKICFKLIQQKQSYRIHMSYHTGNFKFKCDICGIGRASKLNLINHKLTHKEKVTINEIEKHDRYKAKITHNLSEFQKTLLMINGNECPKKRGRPRKDIIRKKKLGRPFKIAPKSNYCPKCNQTFVNKHCLEKHNFRFHTIHECQFCHQRFRNKVSLGNHKKRNPDCRINKIHQNKKNYICEICDCKFKQRNELKHHLKTHVDDSDDEELSEIQNGGQFLDLPKPEETPPKGNIPNNISTSLIKCNYCNREFINETKLELHLLIHTGVTSYQCPECMHRFSSNIQVQNHINRMHKKRIYTCKFCKKKFKIRHNLNKHMFAFHVSETVKHSCDFCEKSFIKLAHLKRHIRTHTSMERTYSCSECEKYFFSKSNLVRHLVVHTNEMAFECKYCTRRFNSAQNMTRHVRAVHDDKENVEF